MISREHYIEKIMPFIDKPLIKVITGMRRTGKSTIMKLLIENLVGRNISRERIIYLNMESLDNEKFRDINVLNEFIKEQKKAVSGGLYLFIDEVQEIRSWEKLVNSLLSEGNIDIIITGSNSRLLSGELSTYLTGRYVEFHIYPLTFSEFMRFRNIINYSDNDFYDFIKFGGLPGIHQIEYNVEPIYQYLSSVSDSIIFKDVVMRNNIRDSSLLEKLIIFIASNIGNIFSARSVADYLKKERRTLGIETIYNYIKYLETAFYINKVERYDIAGKKYLETHEKYYLTDVGLLNASLGYKENSINAYLENIVYLELKKRAYQVYIGKIDDYEIDFIAEKSNEKVYIQVAYLLADEKIREREYRPFYKINDNYPKFVLTMDKIPSNNTDGIIRKYIPDFLIMS
ncbi:MAG: ATP-binding protein [Spirochaetes bacterium]|nr:ATP-binding protein [Spirochaetota bacterium]